MSLASLAGAILHAAGAFRLLHRRLLPGSVSVLGYHALVDRDRPLAVPDWCFLSLQRFEEQMQYLARHFEVVHLEEALVPGRPRSGKPLACVTFDDGFASVYHLARPVLERLRIPATVYLVTDLVDSRGTVWFARLHQAICETRATEVRLSGLRLRLTGTMARAAASTALQTTLRRLNRSDFEPALEHVLEQLGSGGSRAAEPAGPFRMLRSDEIRSLGRDDLVRFGAHTANHQILTRTTPEDARREIDRSVRAVAEIAGRPGRSFAYPNGGPDDFDENAVREIRRAGVAYAVTTTDGPNGPDADPYAIRRYCIGGDDRLFRVAGRIHHVRAELTRRRRAERVRRWRVSRLG